jgi:hypothetical protein
MSQSIDPRRMRADHIEDLQANGGADREGCVQSTNLRAFLNSLIQPLYSPATTGRQEFCAERTERSGCGMVIVTRPSALLIAAMPEGEPFGLYG